MHSNIAHFDARSLRVPTNLGINIKLINIFLYNLPQHARQTQKPRQEQKQQRVRQNHRLRQLRQTLPQRQSHQKIHHQRYRRCLIQKRSRRKQSLRNLHHPKTLHQNAVLYWVRNPLQNCKGEIKRGQKEQSSSSESTKRCKWQSYQCRKEMIRTQDYLQKAQYKLNFLISIYRFESCVVYSTKDVHLKLVLTIIMKSKKAQNIQIADILSYYSSNILHKYSPQLLKQELNDLRVLFAFAGLEVPKFCSELRKKMTDVQKLVKEIASSAAFMESEFLKKPAANLELAYRILSMSAPPLVPSKPSPKLINELKLKFLQSNNVSIQEWYSYFRGESCSLAICIPEQKAQVLIGVQQKDLKNEMEWAITQAFLGTQRSPELLSFFLFFWDWSVKNNVDYAISLIDDIKQLLKNLPIIKIFLQLRRQWRSHEQLDTIKYTTKTKSGQPLAVRWKFDFFTCLVSPKIELQVNGKKMTEMVVSGHMMQGQLTLGFSEFSEPVNLYVIQRELPLFHAFANLPQTLSKFDRNITQFYTKNKPLIKEKCQMIASVLGSNWLPAEIDPAELNEVQAEGIWLYLHIERALLFHIEQQGMLSSRNCQRPFASLLAGQGIGLEDIGRHMSLQEHIFADNPSYELKFYDFKIEEEDGWPYIVYEFRTMRYTMNQKYSRVTRAQGSFYKEQTIHNDNYVIRVKIGLDFTKIRFLGNIFQEGRRIDIQEKDVQQYLKNDWVNYEEHLDVGAKLSWLKVAAAIGSLCRRFIAEKTKLKRTRKQHKKILLDLN